MNTRGAGLAALSTALVAVLAGCGGSATASEPEPVVMPTATEAPLDVEAIARDEITSIAAQGYPTGLAKWVFEDDFENQWGGTASTAQQADLTSIITLDTDPDAYLIYGDDVEASVRSTVRHEFGHALTFFIYPTGANAAAEPWCAEVTESAASTKVPHSECAAEAISEVLATDASDTRVVFYDFDVMSASTTAAARQILVDSRSIAVSISE